MRLIGRQKKKNMWIIKLIKKRWMQEGTCFESDIDNIVYLMNNK